MEERRTIEYAMGYADGRDHLPSMMEAVQSMPGQSEYASGYADAEGDAAWSFSNPDFCAGFFDGLKGISR